MYMWYVFRVCDDKDMSLNTSLTHMALTTAFVDATALRNKPTSSSVDIEKDHPPQEGRGAAEQSGMMFLTTPIVFM